jgi:hypothetical protein
LQLVVVQLWVWFRPCSMQVCEDYFRRDSGAMGSLPRLLAWAASVVQYRSLALCRTMGIFLGLVQPGRVGRACSREVQREGAGQGREARNLKRQRGLLLRDIHVLRERRVGCHFVFVK